MGGRRGGRRAVGCWVARGWRQGDEVVRVGVRVRVVVRVVVRVHVAVRHGARWSR